MLRKEIMLDLASLSKDEGQGTAVTNCFSTFKDNVTLIKINLLPEFCTSRRLS